jgi:hypothetical protein
MRVFLTFDVEDFINGRSIWALSQVLHLLEKHHLKGVFFITGHMAEKIRKYPQIRKRLEQQLIGYHSSSHTVRPGILEFCDVKSYEEAVEISIRKELSHINPLTGREEGIGGLRLLSEIFPQKEIVSFRAPCCAWAPPHLEALRRLGINLDFSSSVSDAPFLFKGITFYPAPLWITYPILSYYAVLRYGVNVYLNFLRRILKNQSVVLAGHPSQFVNVIWWDSIYRNGKMENIRAVGGLPPGKTVSSFRMFDLLLTCLEKLDRGGFARVMSSFPKTDTKITVNRSRIFELYCQNLQRYSRGYRTDGWKPKYLFSHFERFFADDN